MIYLLLPVALILPTLCGWLALRLLEGKTPVLYRFERLAAGFAVGTVLTTFVIFLTEIVGIGNFSFVSMLLTQLILAAALGGIYWKKRTTFDPNPSPNPDPTPWKLWQKILTALLGLLFAAKIISGLIILVGPAYFDDVISNWNMRGKALFVEEEMVLELEPGKAGGVNSYPPTVPLLKAWTAHVGGGWHEGLVNGMHMLWYVGLLTVFYFALRRQLSQKSSLLGTYILSSIPLLTMHASAAYSDCLLALIIFLALNWLYQAVRADGSQRLSFLRLGGLAAGLLVFTKNEALLLHLPPLLLIVAILLVLKQFSGSEKKHMILSYATGVVWVLVPWLLFKWSNNLAFGNAKGISGLELEWHEGVLETIWFNTFFMGQWSLLPVLFLGLLVWKWKTAFKTSLVMFTAFFWMIWLGQLPIYLFTPLYIEALMQTGYARGIIHLIPVIAFAVAVLLVSKTQKTTTQSENSTVELT